ncbi:MAG: SxtJ family membrane protein [Gammaproteobacteria bacterium]|nr:SxtJ family membrane protein [Gammaproteobacteria bacterium]
MVREETVQGSSNRSFGLVFAAVFAIIGLWPLIGDGAVRVWSLAVSLVFLALALLWPVALAPLNRLWTRFGLLLHHIVNPIVMGVLFYLVVTPTGLVMRMLGKDLLRLRFDPQAKSYWIERQPPGPAPETMKDQF